MRNTLNQPQQLAAQIRAINGIVDIAIRAKGFALIASEQRTYGAEVVGIETAHEKKLSNIHYWRSFSSQSESNSWRRINFIR